MPSNEAIELLENVLSSVSESERWQYRYADALKKKREDLKKKIENEKKKIEYYGKDPSKLKELEKELKIATPDNESDAKNIDNVINNYRKGTESYAVRHGNDRIEHRTEKLSKDNTIKKAKEFSENIEGSLENRDYEINWRNDALKGKEPYGRRYGWAGENELVRISNKLKYKPNHKNMHDRINKRTAAFDTTAKHEAAMILIEALNTLLNE